MQKVTKRVKRDERWGDPITGFPRVGDEATEEHDKRRNGHEAQVEHLIQHKQAFDGASTGSSRYTFEACVSGRFETSRDVVEVEEVAVLVSRRGSSGSRHRVVVLGEFLVSGRR